jgi:hypothetical protein
MLYKADEWKKPDAQYPDCRNSQCNNTEIIHEFSRLRDFRSGHI